MLKIDYSRTTTATVAATATENGATTFYEPVDLETMINYLKQNYGTLTIEDTLIKTLIKASRHWIEEKTRRAIVRQTVVLFLVDDEEQLLEVELPFWPVVLTNGNITSAKRVDLEGTETALTWKSDYYIQGLNRLTLIFGKTWTTSGAQLLPLKITYESGYSNIADIPEPLILAVMKLTAENYVNRDDSVDWSINKVPMEVLKLIGPYTDPIL